MLSTMTYCFFLSSILFFPHAWFSSRRVQNPGLEVPVALPIVEAGVVLTVMLDVVAPLNLALLVCVCKHKALSYFCMSVEADEEFPYTHILNGTFLSYIVIIYMHFQILELCVASLHTKRKMGQTPSQVHLLLLVWLEIILLAGLHLSGQSSFNFKKKRYGSSFVCWIWS